MPFAFLRFNFYEWIGNELILYEDCGIFLHHLVFDWLEGCNMAMIAE